MGITEMFWYIHIWSISYANRLSNLHITVQWENGADIEFSGSICGKDSMQCSTGTVSLAFANKNN